ncbi:hypothetical protein Tco_1090719 [Tanacetum coccineum]|uniref:Uncharacterized protein n=1 Tax=Tanacetum coccineum TaxID=301880 RepID=A0ABQ5I633_9ASTR
MLALRPLGTITDEQILVQVLEGKHHVHGVEGSSGLGLQPCLAYKTKTQQENFNRMVAFLSQSQGMPELLNMFPSSTSGNASSCVTPSMSRNPSSSGNPDDGNDDDGNGGDVNKELSVFQ